MRGGTSGSLGNKNGFDGKDIEGVKKPPGFFPPHELKERRMQTARGLESYWEKDIPQDVTTPA